MKGPPPPLPPSVRRLPPAPREKLVERLENFDVFLLPYPITPFMLGVVPAKIYECMAMGRPVISVPLPSLVALKEFVYVAETPEDWARVARNLPRTETPERREARIALAREHTHRREFERWQAVLAAALRRQARRAAGPGRVLVVVSPVPGCAPSGAPRRCGCLGRDGASRLLRRARRYARRHAYRVRRALFGPHPADSAALPTGVELVPALFLSAANRLGREANAALLAPRLVDLLHDRGLGASFAAALTGHSPHADALLERLKPALTLHAASDSAESLLVQARAAHAQPAAPAPADTQRLPAFLSGLGWIGVLYGLAKASIAAHADRRGSTARPRRIRPRQSRARGRGLPADRADARIPDGDGEVPGFGNGGGAARALRLDGADSLRGLDRAVPARHGLRASRARARSRPSIVPLCAVAVPRHRERGVRRGREPAPGPQALRAPGPRRDGLRPGRAISARRRGPDHRPDVRSHDLGARRRLRPGRGLRALVPAALPRLGFRARGPALRLALRDGRDAEPPGRRLGPGACALHPAREPQPGGCRSLQRLFHGHDPGRAGLAVHAHASVIVPMASDAARAARETWALVVRRAPAVMLGRTWRWFFIAGLLAALAVFGRRYPLRWDWVFAFSAAAALSLAHGTLSALYSARDFSGLRISVAGGLLAGVTNTALAIVLIPAHGVTGAAAALVVSFVLGLVFFLAVHSSPEGERCVMTPPPRQRHALSLFSLAAARLRFAALHRRNERRARGAHLGPALVPRRPAVPERARP